MVNNTDTGIAIRNIGAFMFAERLEKVIPGAQINWVKFQEKKLGPSDNLYL